MAVLRGAGADTLDLVLDIDRTGLLEAQLAFERVALLERRAQVHEHDVIAAGLELDLLTGADLEAALDLAHLHRSAVHLHLMHLEAAGLHQRAANKPLRLAP